MIAVSERVVFTSSTAWSGCSARARGAGTQARRTAQAPASSGSKNERRNP